MSSLRQFQENIDAIAARELQKQRETAREQAKSAYEFKAQTKGKKAGEPKAVVDLKPDVAADDNNQHPTAKAEGENNSVPLTLQELLFLPASEDTDDIIKADLGTRLVRSHGEIVVSFGQRRDAAKYFHSEGLLDDAEVSFVGDSLKRGDHELEVLKSRLAAVATAMGAEVSILTTSSLPSPNAMFLVRLVPSSIEQINEVRVAVVGNVDAGKSTMLGVLTRGGLDDGRGRARVNLFRHKHEIETGRTSSVGMEILGFSPSGEPVIPTTHAPTAKQLAEDPSPAVTSGSAARREKLSWDDICKRSSKVISFIDLAGHERYLKTTIFGMTGCSPDYCFLMVGANAGLIGMSKEHLAVALALSVPVIVCITKIDMTPPHVLEATKKQLVKILKSPGCRKTPVFVRSIQDSVELSQVFVKERLAPVFCLSNVTGEGLPLLRSFLNVLPTSQGGEKYEVDAPLEYSISDVFSVPFVGTVVNGVLNSGTIKAGDVVLLGPDSLGSFMQTSVKSIQRKRAPVNSAEAGQSVSFALKRVRRAAVRKGMVIVAKTDELPKAVRRFEGQILVLYHNTTIQPRYQAVMHCGPIRQTVRIVSMDNPKGILRTGDRATVVFEFVSGPEYIKEGSKLLFREGKTKGLGVVTKVGV